MNTHPGVGWNDIYMIGFHSHSFGDLAYRKRRFPSQKWSQHAFMRRIQVLDQDERHSSVRRQGIQHLAKSLETPSRGTDANDREGHLRRGAKFRPMPSPLFLGRHFASYK